MSALRESGQIEQDGDIIMLLSLKDKEDKAGPRILDISKNKEGTCPNVLLAFDGKHQTFSKMDNLQQQAETVEKFKEKVKPKRQKPTAQQAYSSARVYGQYTVLPDETYVPYEK